MSSRSSGSVNRPATVALCALLLGAAIAVLAAASAHAAQFKMVACATSSGAPPYRTETNTASGQHPNGIFDFANWCGGAGGDPPGDAAYMRIAENEAGGSAGEGAYGAYIFETPAYVHFKTGGGFTREPNAFNDGWRARFWGIDFANNGAMFLNQGSGVPNAGTDSARSSIFGPHLWPFGSYLDFHHFYFELRCVRPGGCDRTNYNAVDANGFVFILNDDETPDIYISSKSTPLMQGSWVRGNQWMSWYAHDNGSGLRDEQVSIDGNRRYLIDYQALGQCNATSSQSNGEFSRNYQPCPAGPYDHTWTLDTASLSDGSHSLSLCGQDYGQYQGLNGSGGQTCDSRTIRVDNHAPGAPAGLQILSANPARYLDRFGAQFSLPPDPGSPISKVHYDVVNAAGEAVKPERVISGTNSTQLADIEAPQKAGEYQLRVWLEDAVGLIGPATSVAIPHDTTPPAAPQGVSVTSPTTARTVQGFDVRWYNITDGGSSITAAHYQVLNGAGGVVVPTRSVEGEAPQAISDLDTPRERGSYTLRLWLSDAEGNVGAPLSAPLAYDCVRSDVGGGLSLSAGVGKGGLQTTELREGEASTVSGTLKGAGGSISGAPLCVFSNVITDEDPQFLGIAVTGSAGTYNFALAAGPSREISVRYRPGQRELEAAATLLTRVRPTFTLARKVVHNGGFARFRGEVPGPHNDRVVVVLQVKSGKGWRVFRRYRTREGGRFLMRYRFTQTTTPTTYVMRAQVRAQTGYPYLQGNSRALPLQVRP